MKQHKNSWLVKLDKCPYCDRDLNVSSLSTLSLRDTIGSVICISETHINKCRGNSPKKLGIIRIKTDYLDANKTKIVNYQNQKVLI